MLWRARWERSSHGGAGGNSWGDEKSTGGSSEFRLDVSAERTELLHRAQRFLEEALTIPENMNDPAIRAQVGE